MLGTSVSFAASAQSNDDLSIKENDQKARAVLAAMVEALGGDAWTNMQNRYLEALGIESGSSDSTAILDLAAATGQRRETVCIKQMNRSQRLELSALSRREMAVFMLRIPCFGQRRILTKCAKQEPDKSCERNACRRLFSDWRESLRLSLEEAILNESEDLPVDRAFDH